MATKKKTSNGKGNHLKAAPNPTPEADEDGVIPDDGPGEEDDEDDETLSVAGNALPAPVGDGDGNAFLLMLSQLDRGQGMSIVAGQFQTLVLELAKRAKLIKGEAAGTLTLTLSCEVDHEKQLSVSYRSESKLPRRKGGTSCFFVGDGGVAVSEDPMRPELPYMDDPRSRGRTFRTDNSGNVMP